MMNREEGGEGGGVREQRRGQEGKRGRTRKGEG